MQSASRAQGGGAGIPDLVTLVTLVTCVHAMWLTAKIVLVDGPSTVNGVKRHLFPLKRLSITSLKCNILPGAKLPALMKVCMARKNNVLVPGLACGRRRRNVQARGSPVPCHVVHANPARDLMARGGNRLPRIDVYTVCCAGVQGG